MSVGLIALILSGIGLLWQVGNYVSKKTPTELDDLVFQHPEVEAAVKAAVEAVLRQVKGK
jgi:hypothetical protein